jgi:23S rRNA (guanosine2251-2'-O)-methyltransferase
MSRVIAGQRAVIEALRGGGARNLSVVYVSDRLKGIPDEVESLAEKARVRVEYLGAEAIDSLAEGLRHQGIIAIGGEFLYWELNSLLEELPEKPLLVALDEITDPHNFGAIIRSAVAMGVDGLITLKRRAAPVTPVVVRASTGATEHARIARVTNLARTLTALADSGFEIIGLAGEAEQNLMDLRPAVAGRVLVIGSEGRGMRRLVRERCTELVRIELAGPVESLNASVAAGIAIFASQAQRRGDS